MAQKNLLEVWLISLYWSVNIWDSNVGGKPILSYLDTVGEMLLPVGTFVGFWI
jgi:hypothetical protein